MPAMICVPKYYHTKNISYYTDNKCSLSEIKCDLFNFLSFYSLFTVFQSAAFV